MSTAADAPTSCAGVTADTPTGGAGASASQPNKMFKNCWGCRILSGGGLILAGAYVFMAARRAMKRGGPTSMGTVAQITFAASLTAWGMVVITDPVGKSHRKT